MKTSVALLLSVAFVASAVGSAIGQDSQRVARIGLLSSGGATLGGNLGTGAALSQGLEALGYVEGKNLIIERRSAKGNRALLPELAADLIRLNVAVIVPSAPTAAEAAIKATNTIPIVMPNAGDPIERGFVKNLIRPGGNVTGISGHLEGMTNKQIEWLKETIPTVKNLVVLIPHVRRRSTAEDYQKIAAGLGMDIKSVDFFKSEDLDRVLAKVKTLHADALLTMQHTLTLRHAPQLAGFAIRNRLPFITNDKRFANSGALMSVGVNYAANFRRAATYIDKILKGAHPGNLPIEPPQLELVVNLQTADKLGVKIPPQILLEASDVIK